MSEFLIVHAGEYIGAYHASKCPVVSYAKREKFNDFINGIKENYPDANFHCVRDPKIEQHILDRVACDQWMKKKLDEQIR